MKPTAFLNTLFAMLLLGFVACGGSESGSDTETTDASTQAGGLSEAQLENGIGPIESVSLGQTIDDALAARGQEIFTTKCAACHKMGERYVGPPLGDVLSRRTPEYAMNMMLNPDEMIQKHPEARALLAQYATPMPDQNLTEEDARAVLEYLRANQTEAGGTGQ
jgi:cytochrome c